MKYYNFILSATLFLGCFAGCDNSLCDSVDLNAEVDILSFSIDGKEATIDAEQQTIKLLLPPGADLRQLKPAITVSEGATVMPASGAETDFSMSHVTPVEYRVYNKNMYHVYKVSVEEIKAKIILFKIGNVAGDINESAKTISVFLPNSTGVTALIPVVQYTEDATITPQDGSTVNFTNPVVYTLNYAGAQFNYTVTVTLGAAPGLMIFNGEDVNPAWGALATTVESPYANPLTDGINNTPFCASIMKNGADSDDGGKLDERNPRVFLS